MPRNTKKTGRKKQVPVLPESSEGQHLTVEQKRGKLNLILQDFDDMVASFIAKKKKEVEHQCNRLDAMCEAEIQRLPEQYHEMTFGEYVEKMVEIEKSQHRRSEGVRLSGVLSGMPAKKTSKAKGSTTKKKKGATRRATELENIPEDGAVDMVEPTPMTGRRTRAAARAVAATPLNTVQPALPLFTPRCDPSTQAFMSTARKPRPGELLMSKGGSPVVGEGAEAVSSFLDQYRSEMLSVISEEQMGSLMQKFNPCA